MKANCGECARRWVCDIDPDQCNEWPDPAPETVVDHFRAMTDGELVEFLFEHGADTVCDLVCGGGCLAIDSLKETASQKCRRNILAKLQEPYKEKDGGGEI
jgi:methylase of polypeptide subunit release factors